MVKKNRTLLGIMTIMLLIVPITFVSADDMKTDDSNFILLKAGNIDTDKISEPENNNGTSVQTFSTLSIEEDTGKYYIVQFTGPVREKWKKNVTSTGAIIFSYIPNNAFVFKMNEKTKSQIQELDFVKWIGDYKPSYKYDPEISASENALIASGSDVDNIYHVLLFSAKDNPGITRSIEEVGGNIVSDSGNVLKVRISTDKIPEIAAINEVRWIEKYVQPTVNNDIAASIINVDTIQGTYRLNGSGQIVAVCDSGLDTGVNNNSMHSDLRGRIVNITDLSGDGSSADLLGHGTHVAGSVLGNGSLSSGKYSGMAPEAKLVFQAVGDESHYLYLPENLSDIFQPAYDHGARIHTNSWGSSLNGKYTQESQQVDRFMWENPDMLILFSAGNSGVDSNGDGVIDQGSIGSPATAKNCLTVGASENDRGESFGIFPYLNWGSGSWLANYPVNPIKDDYMADDREGIAAFSSRGPTNDGRIKPDVVAPGTFIISARSSMTSGEGWGIFDDNYIYMGGTSMSTPVTAGSAALVREYYTEVENVSNPSAALIKATLINGAFNLTPGQYGSGDYQEISIRPDYSQGWGRIDIENSIYPQYPQIIKYFDNPEPLDTNESWNTSYDILNAAQPLRVTLVWTDYPGDTAAGLQLVNNLDLKVIGPDDIYYGNGAPDTVNNVEGVELSEPSEGTYKFIVNGTNVPQGPQNFSLVLYFASDINEYPQNNAYTTNSTTAVSVNITHPHGINENTIDMTIDGAPVVHSSENISGGYEVSNITAQPYSEGFHNVSVEALTNMNEQISYNWRFYVSVEDNVLSIEEPEENSVIQEDNFYINASSNKWCNFWYNVDSGTNSTLQAGYSFNTTLGLNEGRHNITIFAEDITCITNSTTVNFTVFTDGPEINAPAAGAIYYLPDSDFALNGSAGIATNVSVYVNGEITNHSYPVSNGIFNISNIPLVSGTNTVNVTSIYNNSQADYFSSNTTIYLSLGGTFDVAGSDRIAIPVPGKGSNISDPIFDFNVTGTSVNPGNISTAISKAEEPTNGSKLVGDAIDFRVMNESDADYSHQFGKKVSLTLGYDHILVNDTGKLVVAYYDHEEGKWIPFRSLINTSEHTVTTNITHLSIYAPLEDNTEPVIGTLTNSTTSSSVTLTWESSDDTDHVGIWKNEAFLANYSGLEMSDTGLSSNKVYNYSLRPVDFAGNIGNWYNVSLATDSVSTTVPSNSGSSGGGGGGGGGSTGEEYENIDFKDVLSVYAGKDEIVDFDFESEKNDIDYVRYESLKNAGKISTTIEILNNTSSFANMSASGFIYRNINIWVGKTGYATEQNIKDPVIGFRVSKEWIEDNELDPATISLKRYQEDVWNSLETQQIDSDEEYLYFEAKTKGFSSFAITAEKTLTIKEDENADVDVTDINTVPSPPSQEENNKTEYGPIKENGSEENSIPSVSGILTIIIFTMALIFVRKQQN